MAARKRPLARFADFGLVARLGKLQVGAPLLSDIAADALHLEAAAMGRSDELLLPLDPARARRGHDVVDETLVADGGGDGQRLDIGRLAQLQLERLAEDFIGLGGKHVEEGFVGESQIARRIAPNDGTALAVEQGTIARLVLAQLPPRILQLLDVASRRRLALACNRRRPRDAREREMQRGETESDAESGENLPRGERTRQQHERSDKARQCGNEEERRQRWRCAPIRAAATRSKRGASE